MAWLQQNGYPPAWPLSDDDDCEDTIAHRDDPNDPFDSYCDDAEDGPLDGNASYEWGGCIDDGGFPYEVQDAHPPNAGVPYAIDDDVTVSGECLVAPEHTPYAYGYTFIEGFMPADSFDALVRPERRLVIMVDGTPVALDAAEVERAGKVGRALVTPLGSCVLGPVDVERAHEADEALHDSEGLRRFFTTAPVNAAIETAAPALGASAGAAADVAGGSILSGVLGGLFAALL
ncbi:hypothetical protein psal_cds_1246 [Pandoravirus salinus]|uniref:Uncharacterized protein n=1 Tax=Pandoravirus salinus TaxID=1349410 RepID=S4W5E7_9VIRU|nr:hypothetical protein psal_cds_1246 [Pandoravirus salinus]AGO85575.1 hypothetical protein psal_cds_1246 [Pandoravirus salinus]